MAAQEARQEERGGGQRQPSAVPPTMRAIVRDAYGTPDVLELRQVPTPEATGDRVLIRIVASSLNVYDLHVTSGVPYMARMVFGVRRPKYPIVGADAAGVVVAVGPDVERLNVGDEVFGDIGVGAFAEYAAPREAALTRKPTGVGFPEAAAVPLAGLTALQGLRDVGGLEPGQRVLVNGASGGVGTFAVQIAKALGAEVTAVCSTEKVETVRSLGADRVIDYTTDDYTLTEADVDLLFDNVGDRPWRETRRVLAPGGIDVTVTGPKRRILGPLRHFVARKVASSLGGERMTWFTAAVRANDLATLAEMLESGAVSPVVETVHRLEDVPEGLWQLAAGHARGKHVIRIG